MTAVDLQPQIMVHELLIRRPEPEPLGQSLQFHRIVAWTHLSIQLSGHINQLQKITPIWRAGTQSNSERNATMVESLEFMQAGKIREGKRRQKLLELHQAEPPFSLHNCSDLLFGWAFWFRSRGGQLQKVGLAKHRAPHTRDFSLGYHLHNCFHHFNNRLIPIPKTVYVIDFLFFGIYVINFTFYCNNLLLYDKFNRRRRTNSNHPIVIVAAHYKIREICKFLRLYLKFIITPFWILYFGSEMYFILCFIDHFLISVFSKILFIGL